MEKSIWAWGYCLCKYRRASYFFPGNYVHGSAVPLQKRVLYEPGFIVSGAQLIWEGGCPMKEFRLQGGRRGMNQRVMLAWWHLSTIFTALRLWSLRSCLPSPFSFPHFSLKGLCCSQRPHRLTTSLFPRLLHLFFFSVGFVFPPSMSCSPILFKSLLKSTSSESFAWLFCVRNPLNYIRYYLFVYCLYPLLKCKPHRAEIVFSSPQQES